MLDFKWNVKQSFKKARKDLEDYKANVNEWVIFLDSKNKTFEKKIDKLEVRIDRLEDAILRMMNLRD